jgi:hypothetical protein
MKDALVMGGAVLGGLCLIALVVSVIIAIFPFLVAIAGVFMIWRIIFCVITGTPVFTGKLPW